MLHIIFALIAIGLALFLWERFPAFKWIVAVFISVILLFLLIIFGVSSFKKSEKESERQRAVEISKSTQEVTPNQKQADSDKDPLVIFLREMEKEKK